jgi:ABC-type Na+ efflux pump permease subunit
MTTTFIIAAVVLSAFIIWILFFKKSTEEKDTKIDTFVPKDFKVTKPGVKKTFVVPVGSATKDEAKEAINKLMSAHKETSDLFIPQIETKPKKKWTRRKKKVVVDGTPTLSTEVNKQIDTETPKPKKKRGRKPKNKGGDKDQLILS